MKRNEAVVTMLFFFMAIFGSAQEAESKPERNVHYRSSLTVLNDATEYGKLQVPVPQVLNQTLIEPVITMRYRERWSVAGSAVNLTQTDGAMHNQTHMKEAYAGLSAGDFDFTAGRRIVRWGTGYAFTPVGVLDPPRIATNPTDRLNTNVGRDMVKVDYVHGQQAMQLAWASSALAPAGSSQQDITAFRYNVLMHGFDTALIASHDQGGDSEGAMAFTRVFGQALEAHGEFAWRDQAALLLGGKFAMKNGAMILAEFYTPPNTEYFRDSASLIGQGRQSYLFFSVGKSRLRERPGWKAWDLSMYDVVNLRDRSAVQALDMTRRFGQYFSAYSHCEFPLGGAATEYGATPYLTAISTGVRFQL
ncbi:hypothetical protein ACOBR2_18065 [Telmatobacter bradus]|uniref:hypothetical protein n=1 Tax=Telmatobacter bradus TaxID=474953 RepID=UPI003B437B3E